MLTLQGSFSANGTSNSSQVRGTKAFIQASGSFGSGTLTAEVSFDGGVNWASPTDAKLTASGAFQLDLPLNTFIRLVLSGATSPAINFCIADRS